MLGYMPPLVNYPDPQPLMGKVYTLEYVRIHASSSQLPRPPTSHGKGLYT